MTSLTGRIPLRKMVGNFSIHLPVEGNCSNEVFDLIARLDWRQHSAHRPCTGVTPSVGSARFMLFHLIAPRALSLCVIKGHHPLYQCIFSSTVFLSCIYVCMRLCPSLSSFFLCHSVGMRNAPCTYTTPASNASAIFVSMKKRRSSSTSPMNGK